MNFGDGFRMKISEYRSRLKMLTRTESGLPIQKFDDGIYLTRNKDDIHSLYKMEIMKRLLRDGKLQYEEVESEVRTINSTLHFHPSIFRSAYEIVFGYLSART